MLFKLGPRTKRNIARIIPFGIIWLVLGWYDLFTDAAATGGENVRPSTDITLTTEVVIFASIAVLLVGLLVGTFEVYFFSKLFVHKRFWQKLLYKTGFYLLFMLVIILITYPIAAAIELEVSIFDKLVGQKFLDFLTSLTFASGMVSMTFSLFLSLFYSGISDNVGHRNLLSFFTGRYHNPKEEERIFMFLDMRSSTTLAEKLGHIRYFDLLREYYNELSNAIIDNSGEVYQYVGDEIVISWIVRYDIDNNNCINCFFDMKKALHARESYYDNKYGVAPTFKAGMHYGQVTAGEIGALKKEIFFTGDVLNATARIQGMCNQFGEELLISGELLKILNRKEIITKSLGEIQLKGREKPLELIAVGK